MAQTLHMQFGSVNPKRFLVMTSTSYAVPFILSNLYIVQPLLTRTLLRTQALYEPTPSMHGAKGS